MFLDASRGGHVPDGATAALLGNPLLVASFVLAAPRGESVAEDDCRAGRGRTLEKPRGFGGRLPPPKRQEREPQGLRTGGRLDAPTNGGTAAPPGSCRYGGAPEMADVYR